MFSANQYISFVKYTVGTLAEVIHLDLPLLGICSFASVLNQQQAKHVPNTTVINATMYNVRELTLEAGC